MWSKEEASKESARQLFLAIAKFSENLARLQEQQKISEATSVRFRKEIDALAELLDRIEQTQSECAVELKHFIARVQSLENQVMDTLDEKYLERGEFEQYKNALEKAKLESEKESLKKLKATRKQVGIIAGGLVAALAPKAWQLFLWIIEQLTE